MTQASRKRIAKVKLTLTKRAVESLEPGVSPWIAWDDRLTGFGVRVQPSGTKAFVVNYRSGTGGRRAPNRRVVIGRYGPMTPDRARRVAQEVLGRVAVGDDPAAERGAARRMPLLREAFAEFLAANPNRKPNTLRLYRGQIRYCFGDWLARPLDAITRRDVEARFHLLTERHGWAIANHATSLLRSAYRRPCVDHQGLRNPVDLWLDGGGRYHRSVRRRISAPAEVLPRWRVGIETEVIVPTTRDIFWFGFYTGMRVGEIFGLRWDHVDLERGTFRIEETKSGVPLELPITRQLAQDPDPPAGGERQRDRPGGSVGLPVLDQRLGTRRGAAAPVCAHRTRRRNEVLVPRPPQRLHHGGRARAHAAPLAHEAPREPRAPGRRDRGLRRRLVHRAASRARPAHRGPHRGAGADGPGRPPARRRCVPG